MALGFGPAQKCARFHNMLWAVADYIAMPIFMLWGDRTS